MTTLETIIHDARKHIADLERVHSTDMIAMWDNGLCVGVDGKDGKTPYVTNALRAASVSRYQGLTDVQNGRGESPKLVRRIDAARHGIEEQHKLIDTLRDAMQAAE